MAVVGLSSGVRIVELGYVRMFVLCCVAVACVRAGVVNLIGWVADAVEGLMLSELCLWLDWRR